MTDKKLTDEEQEEAVKASLKSRSVVAKTKGVQSELSAGESLALAFSTVTSISNKQEWMNIATQIDALDFKIRSAVGAGTIPYNQAGIEFDAGKMFGSPANNMNDAVREIAKASCEEELREEERKHQWSMGRLGALATLAAALIAGGGLGYLIAALRG